MNALRIASLTAALLLTASVDLFAQHGPPVAPGDRVRVSRLGSVVPPLVCTVSALKADTLVLNTEQRTDALELPLASLAKLEVSRGQKPATARGAKIGFLAGAAVGAGVGAALGASFGEQDCSSSCIVGIAGIGALAGGIGGTLVGLSIGAATNSDLWEPVPLDQLRVGVSPVTRGGVAVWVVPRLGQRSVDR